MQVFETIVGDAKIDDFGCLFNQKPKISSFEHFEKLRSCIRNGKNFIYYETITLLFDLFKKKFNNQKMVNQLIIQSWQIY